MITTVKYISRWMSKEYRYAAEHGRSIPKYIWRLQDVIPEKYKKFHEALRIITSSTCFLVHFIVTSSRAYFVRTFVQNVSTLVVATGNVFRCR